MGLKAVVIDDSGAARGLIVRILQQLGCSVAGLASDGAEGVELYKRVKPDFVTMDLVMPQMTGVEALKAIKAVNPNAVVIMVTSINMKKEILECIKEGASHYVLKPITAEKMATVLKACFKDSFDAREGF